MNRSLTVAGWKARYTLAYALQVAPTFGIFDTAADRADIAVEMELRFVKPQWARNFVPLWSDPEIVAAEDFEDDEIFSAFGPFDFPEDEIIEGCQCADCYAGSELRSFIAAANKDLT